MANSKKNFYTVFKGRIPGVYTRWSGEGGAEEQVKGYPGAIFKGFGTRPEAEEYLRSGNKERYSTPKLSSELEGETRAQAAVPQVSRPPLDYQEELDAGKVVVFTDGASTGNPGPGGYGVVLLQGEIRKELSGGFCCTTNNRMELLACIVALRELKQSVPVVIYSDSRYVVNAVEKGWARRWRSNNWMRAPDARGQAQRAENRDLWEQMLDLLNLYSVDFRWVRGHASYPENERCDRLAVQAAHARGLPTDPGFGGNC